MAIKIIRETPKPEILPIKEISIPSLFTEGRRVRAWLPRYDNGIAIAVSDSADCISSLDDVEAFANALLELVKQERSK